MIKNYSELVGGQVTTCLKIIRDFDEFLSVGRSIVFLIFFTRRQYAVGTYIQFILCRFFELNMYILHLFCIRSIY